MRGSLHQEDSSPRGSWADGLFGRQNSHRDNRARTTSDKEIDSLSDSQAQDRPSRREREFRKDGIAIWLLSIMMAMVFLMVLLLAIEVRISRPKNTTPTESAWYHHALPPLQNSQSRPSWFHSSRRLWSALQVVEHARSSGIQPNENWIQASHLVPRNL